MQRIVRGRARDVNRKEFFFLCIASEIFGKVFSEKYFFWQKIFLQEKKLKSKTPRATTARGAPELPGVRRH
jgi:hypothetical protein